MPAPSRFAADAITQSVIERVNAQFAGHPGSLHDYGWPATREQALQVLDAFIRERLPQFGLWQDVMWEGQPWLYHAHISVAHLRDAITQTLQHGYAHHIQRSMVTGLYALLLGEEPKQVHAWYQGVYIDAVEWVELPNTLGMSPYADGGVMASKP